MTMGRVEVDVRGLPHPERPPLVMKKLKEHDEIDLIVEIEPKPLMNMLENMGYVCNSKFEGGSWRVTITRREG